MLRLTQATPCGDSRASVGSCTNERESRRHALRRQPPTVHDSRSRQTSTDTRMGPKEHRPSVLSVEEEVSSSHSAGFASCIRLQALLG